MNKYVKKIAITILISIILINSFCLSVAGATNVSNCGGDENGGISGGQAGDQTGGEYAVKPWYNYGIEYVLRYKDSNAAMTIAQLAVSGANNDMVGYDQGERHTYWEQLERVNYNPSAISTPCEADCSGSTCANVKAAGFILNNEELKAIDEWGWTGSMRGDFEAHGWQVLSGAEYTNNPANLQPGDVLLNEQNHTNIYVGDAEGFTAFPIDDITVNLDEQNFQFSGAPKTVTYSGTKKAGEWIFSLFSQFVDFIVALITNGIKTSILGWAMTFEKAIDSSLKFIEGADD